MSYPYIGEPGEDNGSGCGLDIGILGLIIGAILIAILIILILSPVR